MIMGWCKLHGEWQPGWSSEACAAAGGQYSETGPGTCFVATILTRSYGQAILELGQTYGTAIAFRDQVLGSSPPGTQLVENYYRYNPTILPLVMGDYELMAEAMTTWTSIVSFVRATVAAARGGEAAEEFPEQRLTQELHDNVTHLLDRLQSKSEDADFHTWIDEVKEELARYVNLSPQQALETIHRK
ncbi:hypothetical protein M1P56_16715 [Streptomyces sp. HU2014]|uniref:Uncharacterized protein n=1 Tax=Streptomyces albireticuli TaxID=1940 RepID=A0A1Z2LEA3_9ACTN|nr:MULTISPECIES: hypothetical protein [Streptomyces]ARZ72561.1 hypothetical protein SMD11_6985 [Streptomyces albireticuli]UQI45883.1 hypothetical protein M1P56_16715 [Streptomyces sp. HU2014]